MKRKVKLLLVVASLKKIIRNNLEELLMLSRLGNFLKSLRVGDLLELGARLENVVLLSLLPLLPLLPLLYLVLPYLLFHVFPFRLTCTADDLCVRACFHFLPDTFPAITPSYVGFPSTGLFGSSEEGTACLFDGGGPFSFSTSMAATSSSDTSLGASFSALFRL
nr:hypothetical protein Iba_scaffold82175CG0010 [Ipomoea batatas]